MVVGAKDGRWRGGLGNTLRDTWGWGERGWCDRLTAEERHSWDLVDNFYGVRRGVKHIHYAQKNHERRLLVRY